MQSTKDVANTVLVAINLLYIQCCSSNQGDFGSRKLVEDDMQWLQQLCTSPAGSNLDQ